MKKEKKAELFSTQDIEVSCPQKMVWDEMDVVGDGRRHCEGCDKTLFDVTGYTKEEVAELQKKHGNICVAVTNTVIASSVALSLAACSSPSVNVPKQEMKVTKEQNVSTHKPIEKVEEVVVTEVAVVEPEAVSSEVITQKVKTVEDKNDSSIIVPLPVELPPQVVVGLPARRVVPCPNLGKRVLNSLKDFFGVGKVENCYDY